MNFKNQFSTIGILVAITCSSSLFAQGTDYIFTCRGRIDQDQRRLVLLNLNFKAGGLIIDGDLNGDPIVGSNFGNGESIQVVGYPKSQDTGNTRDIVHKMTVNITKSNGLFNMNIVGANGHTYFLSGRGDCQIQNKEKNIAQEAKDPKYYSDANTNAEKLRLELEEAKRKQAETEEQLRIAQQSTPTSSQIAPTQATGRRIALVVGNANYKVRPLRNPRNDADDMSRSLRTSGFEVIDLRDASLQQMRTGVRQFGDRLLNNDVGLVYYSGHGVEVKGRNYFIPVNADVMREDEIADQGLDVSLILEKMNTAGKGVNILIVDACRDDPFGRSFRSSSRGLAQMDAPKGTIIAYATSPGKVASDGEGRNSPYTKNLVRAMQQPNKPIEQVFKEVRRAVQDETKNQQTPWENTSLSGDFYFKVQR
jgi:hypothetical protein